MLALMVVIVTVFTIWSAKLGGQFLSLNTIVSVGDLMIVTSFLAIGAGMLLVSGNLDFSSSAIGAFSCVIMAACLKYWNLPTGVAIAVALVSGVLWGLINGILVNEFSFQPYIATMAMSFVIKGAMQMVSRSPETGIPQSVNVSNAVTKFIGTYKIGGLVPFAFVVAALAFIVYGIILSRTKFGKQVYMVGGNPQAARLAGINPKKITYILYANSGFLAAIAGVIYMGRASQGDLDALQLNQFTGFTAAMLGGISFGGGNGSMAGVFVGLVILSTFNFGAVSVYLTKYWTTVLSGVLLLVALSMDLSIGSRIKEGFRSWKKTMGSAKHNAKGKEMRKS